MATTTKNLGIVSPVPKGLWSASTMYQKLNIVTHNNSVYIAVQSSQAVEPNVATNWSQYWILLTRGFVISQETGNSADEVMSQAATTNALNATTNALNTKFDKAGGTITGDTVIEGNLTVNGKEYISSVENLNVENSMIYSNASGQTLEQLAGLGIKTGDASGDVYGIVYDIASDSVKLGLGLADENGKFTFKEGEGEPIAVRDDDSLLSDGCLLAWDATNKKLIQGNLQSGTGTNSLIQKVSDGDTENIASGRNVTVLGIGNTSSINTDGSLLAGNNNNNGAKYALLCGSGNINDTQSSFIYGDTNTNENSVQSLIGGNSNTNIDSPQSILSGYKNKNKNGNMSIIGGNLNENYGTMSILGGYYNINNSSRSLLVGHTNSNKGNNSILCGTENINDTNGWHSLLLGSKNINNAYSALLSGTDNKNYSNYGVVFGNDNTNKGFASIVGGLQCETNNDVQFVYGQSLKASETVVAQVLFGTYNLRKDDAFFIIGNGWSDDNRSNVFETHSGGIVCFDKYSKLDGTKPTTNSLLQVSSTGAISYKPLSELNKTYSHTVYIEQNSDRYTIYFTDNISEKVSKTTLGRTIGKVVKGYRAAEDVKNIKGFVMSYSDNYENSKYLQISVFDNDNTTLLLNFDLTSTTDWTIEDKVEEVY